MSTKTARTVHAHGEFLFATTLSCSGDAVPGTCCSLGKSTVNATALRTWLKTKQNKTEQTNKQEQKKGEPVSPGSALGAGSGHGSGRSAARAALRAGPGRAARGAALLPPGAARGSVRPLRAERRLRKAPSRLRGAAVSIVNAICH